MDDRGDHQRLRNAFPAALWLLACALAVGALPSTAAAGAWVPAPGEGYVKLWTKWLHGAGHHDGDGNTIDYGTYNELYVATYGELGVFDKLAVTWNLDLLRSAWLEDPRSGQTQGHQSIGDPRLGVRYALLQRGPLAVGADVSVLAPLAPDRARQAFVYEDGTVAGDLRLGAGVFEVGAELSVGLGMEDYYLQAAAGYVIRTGGFDDVVRFQVEGGTNFGDRIAARLRVTGNLALAADSAPYRENPSGIGNGVSYLGFALEADYAIVPNWFVGFTFEGGVLHIRRQTGGPVLSLYGAHRF